MRKTISILSSFTIILLAAISACNTGSNKTQSAATAVSKDSLIKRGAYLVTIGGCDDCHSPKKMGPMGPEVDPELRLSGFPASRPLPKFDSNFAKKGLMMMNEDGTAAAGPWGISFTGNLTSDATGAGSWPVENFVTALRKGKLKGHQGGRDLLPPMPWQNYSQMTDDDLRALHAFLQSTKPVENIVPAPKQFADLK